jgi:hypothetical protein
LDGAKDMKPLTKEKLEEVKKFADDIGFKGCIKESGESAFFEVGLPSANITVYYETEVGYWLSPDLTVRGHVTIGWSSCDGGQVSVSQTQDFIKFMGYAVKIANKLKEE